MADRRKSGKRKTAPARDAKRLSLLDLPSAADAGGELPTNPGQVIRAEQKRTLLPAAAEPIADASLESLARLAHRGAGLPVSRPVTTRALKPYLSDEAPRSERVVELERAPLLPRSPDVSSRSEPRAFRTEPSPPPDFGRATTLPPAESFRPSSLPPPIQMPSQPPRVRARANGNAWLRTLGVIVLSATVGAVVSSAIWGVKSELAGAAARSEIGDESSGRAAAATEPRCATAVPATTANSAPLVPSTTLASAPAVEAPRISFDALPREGQLRSEERRGAVAAAHVSLDAPSDRASRTTTGARASRSRDARDAETPRSSRERRTRAPEAPPALPDQPSRASIDQAVARSAAAAASCDTGPQDGKVTVTFAPSGAVQSVSLVKGFGDAAVNGCVLRAFGRARVPAFSGEPVAVRKTVAW